MREVLTPLLRRYSDCSLSDAGVIPWSCPVPIFGNSESSVVATVGLNPSNREFVDGSGAELTGENRRFETLGSLELPGWADASLGHLQRIISSFQTYFSSNPYDGWFRRLDSLISDTGASYYNGTASHLDLVPFATAAKWAHLSLAQRRLLQLATGNTLAAIVRDSKIRVLILNGASVVAHFQSFFKVELDKSKKPAWALRAKTDSPVAGFSFQGRADSLAGMPLDRRLLILGFNHNIQSSFGVTAEVIASIRRWIGKTSEEHLD